MDRSCGFGASEVRIQALGLPKHPGSPTLFLSDRFSLFLNTVFMGDR